jgi:hypothetical protein
MAKFYVLHILPQNLFLRQKQQKSQSPTNNTAMFAGV